MSDLAGLGVLLLVAALLLVLLLTAILLRELRHPPRRRLGYAIARGLAGDPAEADLPFEEWTLDRPDGARLPVWDVAGRGAGPAVVFAHGWGQSRIDVLARLDPWHDLARRLVMYDLRGHGDARGGASRLGHRESEDLRALVERLGVPCILAGSSMGAAIAIETAAALADAALVAGVVAYAPSADFHRSLRTRLRDQGYPARPMTDLALLALRLAGIRPANAARAAPRLRCPLLVIHGGADRVCPPADATLVASLAPDGAARLIDGAGHLDFHAAGAAEHARLVRGFVEQVSRAARSSSTIPRAGGNPAEVIR